MDVFNRTLVAQLPKVPLDYAVAQLLKVSLDYAVDLSRYCPTRKFYSNLRYVETCSHSVQYTYIYYVGPKFTDCFVYHVGTLYCQ